MRVLLINSKINFDDVSFFPLGLGYIASMLLKDDHEVEVLDINGYGYSEQEVVDRLKSYRDVDIVGISGHVITYKYQKWLIPRVKQLIPNAVVASGGGLASTCSDILFRETNLDVTVLGEGERTVPELVSAIADGTSLEKVNGIKYRDGDQIKTTPPRDIIKDLDVIPNPARELFPMDIYASKPVFGRKYRNVDVFSSRGCPFDCSFCYHLFGRRSVRYRSAENVIEELASLKELYNINHVVFLDDNMMVNKKRLLEICELIKGLKLTWACLGRVDSSEVELLNIMKSAGCVHVDYGMESANQEMLNNMNKNSTVEKAMKTVRVHKEVGLSYGTTFIFGTPGETRETIKETTDFIIDNDICAKIFFMTPYPMTPLWDTAKQRGLIKDDEKFLQLLTTHPDSNLVANFSELSDEELIRLKEEAERAIARARCRRHPSLLARKLLAVPGMLIRKLAS